MVIQQPPSPLFTLYVQALGNRVCVMCWKFHLTLLFPSPISLSSSLHSVASDCLQPPHFLILLPLLLSPISLGLTAFLLLEREMQRRVNEQSRKKNWERKIREWADQNVNHLNFTINVGHFAESLKSCSFAEPADNRTSKRECRLRDYRLYMPFSLCSHQLSCNIKQMCAFEHIWG